MFSSPVGEVSNLAGVECPSNYRLYYKTRNSVGALKIQNASPSLTRFDEVSLNISVI